MPNARGSHHLWPHERAGVVAAASGAVLIAAIAFQQVMIALGERGGDDILDNLWLAGPAFVAVAAALGAVVGGLVSMLHDHERSVPVVSAAVAGALVVLFVILELAFPH